MSTTARKAGRVSDTEYVMERTPDAAPDRVFASYTNAEQVAQWWGQRTTTVEVEALDVRPGGKWRVVQRDPVGNAYEFFGKYLEVTASSIRSAWWIPNS